MHNYILLFAEKYLIYNWQVKKKKERKKHVKNISHGKKILLL